jgi:hypothetical protein
VLAGPPRRLTTGPLEELDVEPLDILDVTVTNEIRAEGPWWSATVYWSSASE